MYSLNGVPSATTPLNLSIIASASARVATSSSAAIVVDEADARGSMHAVRIVTWSANADCRFDAISPALPLV